MKKFLEFIKESKEALIIAATMFLILIGTQVLTGICFWQGTSVVILLNALILISIFLIFLGIFKRVKVSLIMTTFLSYIIAIINYLLIVIRGIPFSFADIFSIKAAINVLSDFNVAFEYKFVISIFIFIMNLILISLMDDKKLNASIRKSKTFFLGFILFCRIWITSSGQLYYVTEESDQYYGVLYRFLKTTKDTFLQKPSGYSKELVEDILERYEYEDIDSNNVNENKDKPNIIVIMNESFADINKIYDLGLKENVNNFSKISSNMKLYSPTYGGTTANCEYEFLTGFTSSFYGNNVPYQQYIKDDLLSIANVAKDNGYTTSAMHLYKSSSYNRDLVYSYLGFDNALFDNKINDIGIQKILNSDENTYKKIIDIFENKKENEKLFNFTITLQNHLPFVIDFESYKEKYPQYEKEISKFEERYKKENYTENEELNGYLNSIRISDEAIEDLLSYFKEYDEKVIIMFFGDHQPRINEEKIDSAGNEKKYEVSYALWSNYEMEKEEIDSISINYLPVILSENAGLDMPSQYRFLSDLKEKIPVITYGKYMDSEGTWYDIEDSESKHYNLIKEYEYLQYYYMSNDYKK